MNLIKCNKGHSAGWIMSEEILIDSDNLETHEIECYCNYQNCNEKKLIKFTVSNVEEIE